MCVSLIDDIFSQICTIDEKEMSQITLALPDRADKYFREKLILQILDESRLETHFSSVLSRYIEAHNLLVYHTFAIYSLCGDKIKHVRFIQKPRREGRV